MQLILHASQKLHPTASKAGKITEHSWNLFHHCIQCAHIFCERGIKNARSPQLGSNSKGCPKCVAAEHQSFLDPDPDHHPRCHGCHGIHGENLEAEKHRTAQKKHTTPRHASVSHARNMEQRNQGMGLCDLCQPTSIRIVWITDSTDVVWKCLQLENLELLL